MQTLANVQSQIRARRIRMSEENQGLLQQLQQKRENEVQKLTAYYVSAFGFAHLPFRVSTVGFNFLKNSWPFWISLVLHIN